MQTVRRLITVFSCLICVWVFVSVGGAFFDQANAEFWSASLMWSLLSSLLVAPALVFAFTGPSPSRRRAPPSPPGEPLSEPEQEESPLFENTEGVYPVARETDEPEP